MDFMNNIFNSKNLGFSNPFENMGRVRITDPEQIEALENVFENAPEYGSGDIAADEAMAVDYQGSELQKLTDAGIEGSKDPDTGEWKFSRKKTAKELMDSVGEFSKLGSIDPKPVGGIGAGFGSLTNLGMRGGSSSWGGNVSSPYQVNTADDYKKQAINLANLLAKFSVRGPSIKSLV